MSNAAARLLALQASSKKDLVDLLMLPPRLAQRHRLQLMCEQPQLCGLTRMAPGSPQSALAPEALVVQASLLRVVVCCAIFAVVTILLASQLRLMK